MEEKMYIKEGTASVKAAATELCAIWLCHRKQLF
jgi:hypothetical protein